MNEGTSTYNFCSTAMWALQAAPAVLHPNSCWDQVVAWWQLRAFHGDMFIALSYPPKQLFTCKKKLTWGLFLKMLFEFLYIVQLFRSLQSQITKKIYILSHHRLMQCWEIYCLTALERSSAVRNLHFWTGNLQKKSHPQFWRVRA